MFLSCGPTGRDAYFDFPRIEIRGYPLFPLRGIAAVALRRILIYITFIIITIYKLFMLA